MIPWWFWSMASGFGIVAMVMWAPKGERASTLGWCASTYVLGLCLWGTAFVFGWWTP